MSLTLLISQNEFIPNLRPANFLTTQLTTRPFYSSNHAYRYAHSDVDPNPPPFLSMIPLLPDLPSRLNPPPPPLKVPLIAHTLYDAIILFFVHLEVASLSSEEQQEVIAAVDTADA